VHLIVVILPSDILSDFASFWISSPVIARLLEWEVPARSKDVREVDAAEALFAREVLNPGIEDVVNGLAIPVARAKCWLGGGLVLPSDFLLGEQGIKLPSGRVELVGMSLSPLKRVWGRESETKMEASGPGGGRIYGAGR
jgi:hypothetical protein